MLSTMRIETIPIERINPAPYNPRIDLRPGDLAYERLRRSMDEFGCVEPLVWNERTGVLVGGHQRLKVLVAQGARAAQVSVVDLDPAREKALNVALNRITGDWDRVKLAELLDELTRMPEIDLAITGFDAPEARALIAEALNPLADADERADVTFDAEGPPVTRPGELLELGRHRLLCGDSADAACVRSVVDAAGGAADLLFTDPPYNVDYYGGDRPAPSKARPKESGRWSRIYGDNRDQEDYTAWLGAVLRGATACLRPGSAVYIWNGHRQFGPMGLLLPELGVKVACVITWAKESFAIGYGDYNQQTEFCMYGWVAGAHRWRGPANESTLWEVRRDPTRSYVHPTQKPLELAERAMRNSTLGGEVVLDCFLGSGTTLIAAERCGRACAGLEIDPRWCDAIARRYIAFVGEERAGAALSDRYRRPDQEAAR